MKLSEAKTIGNQQYLIKCSQCGNEKSKFYLITDDLTKTNEKTECENSEATNQFTETQKHLAHLFEAQYRFGE